MKTSIALSLALLSLTSVVALAGPPKKDAKTKPATKTAKMVDVMHCPITGEVVKDKAGKTATVANYKVHFCCAGCPEEFAKMDKKTQLAKAKDAAAKDAPAKSAPKKRLI